MAKIRKRRRGTAIVGTDQGILVTAGRGWVFSLPGGEANKGESRSKAARRELTEETGLKPYYAKYLFRHVGKVHKSQGHAYTQDHHTVCLTKAHGDPSPRHETEYVASYRPGSGVRISGVPREIIERYYSDKKKSGLWRKQTSILDRPLEWFSWGLY